MQFVRVFRIFLCISILTGILAVPVMAYSSASQIISPNSLVSQSGSASGNPIAVLESLQQSGTQDNPAAYIQLSTPNQIYLGYQDFQIPSHIPTTQISNILLQINFKGPADSAQVWTWSIYHWQSELWVRVGDTIGTTPGRWNDLLFLVRNFQAYLSPSREIRIQARSSNGNGDAKIDYEALHITYIPLPSTATNISYPTPTDTSLPPTLPSPTSTLAVSGTKTVSPSPTPTYIAAACKLTIPPSLKKGQNPYTSTRSTRQSLLYVPHAYGDNPQQTWPLVVFLHGAGTRGNNLNLLKFESLPQTLQTKTDYPALVLSPQLTTQASDEYWTNAAVTNSLFTLIDELQQKYCIDPKRIYLTGFSLGGEGVWGIGLNYPKKFAALVPVAGFYGNTASQWVPGNICDLKTVPIWAFHGENDGIVPLKAEADLVHALQACGGNVQFTIYPNGSHDISAQVYINNDSLYAWLFAQRLP